MGWLVGAVGIETSVLSLGPADSIALAPSPHQKSPHNAPVLRPFCDQFSSRLFGTTSLLSSGHDLPARCVMGIRRNWFAACDKLGNLVISGEALQAVGIGAADEVLRVGPLGQTR
jgi:hypothetical protein